MSFLAKESAWEGVIPSLSPDQKELINDGILLLSRLEGKSLDHISDYSFLVAPFAKAYEGFLKDFFLKLGLISEKDYFSDYFRVGKVLNPNLKRRSFSIYSPLEEMEEEGERLAFFLWRAWKKGRNLIFHYFPHNLNKLSFKEAEERIDLIRRAMVRAITLLDRKGLVGDNSLL